jgi:thiol-disulfide isomerase/thioredoxin
MNFNHFGKALGLALLLVAIVQVRPAAAAVAKVGKPAPKFTIHTFDNREFTLDQLRGKVVVINYWATWCGPCRKEMPLLDLFERHFRDNGLEVFAITVESSIPKSKRGELEKLLSFPLASKLSGSGYGIMHAVPTNYVIDRSGIVRYAKAGAFELDDLNSILVPLLREPAPAN